MMCFNAHTEHKLINSHNETYQTVGTHCLCFVAPSQLLSCSHIPSPFPAAPPHHQPSSCHHHLIIFFPFSSLPFLLRCASSISQSPLNVCDPLSSSGPLSYPPTPTSPLSSPHLILPDPPSASPSWGLDDGEEGRVGEKPK